MQPRAACVVADSASRSARDVVIRAALVAVRPRLDSLDVDLISDDTWPAVVATAVDALEQWRRRRWILPGRQITAALDPHDDAQFQPALAVVPYSIGCTGLSGGRVIFDVNDTGTSAWFRLTPGELHEVHEYMTTSEVSTDLLIVHDR